VTADAIDARVTIPLSRADSMINKRVPDGRLAGLSHSLTSLTAFVGVLTSRALNRADDQRRVAARLRAYLLYWQQRTIELKVWATLAEGEEWYAEDQKMPMTREPARAKAEKSVAWRKRYQDEHAADLRRELSSLGELWVEAKTAIAKLQAFAAENVFHARDLNLVMGPAKQGTSVRFRVLIDGQPPEAAHGIDVDEKDNGTVREQRVGDARDSVGLLDTADGYFSRESPRSSTRDLYSGDSRSSLPAT
jgi:Thioredoxin like C-terminal domain